MGIDDVVLGGSNTVQGGVSISHKILFRMSRNDLHNKPSVNDFKYPISLAPQTHPKVRTPHGLQPKNEAMLASQRDRLQLRIHYDMASTSSAEVKALLQDLGAQVHRFNSGAELIPGIPGAKLTELCVFNEYIQ